MPITALLWIAAVAGAASAGSPPPPGQELLELRQEVYRLGVEVADFKIASLERELAEATSEQERGEREEAVLLDELSAPDGEEGELAERKSGISSTELPEVKTKKQEAAARASYLLSRLETQRERRRKLAALAEEVSRTLAAYGQEKQP